MDTEQQPQQLFEECRVKFEDEEPIRMLDEPAILGLVLGLTHPPVATGALHNVAVGRVGTYIYERELSKKESNRRIVFLTFASHWAVMVFEQKSPTKYGFGYHLTFHDAAAAELSPPAGTSRAVEFTQCS
jgi:hypothetical protein